MFALTSFRDTLGTGIDVVISISLSISDISSEKPFGIVVSPLLFIDCCFLSDFFNCRLWNSSRPITNTKHSNTPIVTDINRYRKNFSWFSANEKKKIKARKIKIVKWNGNHFHTNIYMHTVNSIIIYLSKWIFQTHSLKIW